MYSTWMCWFGVCVCVRYQMHLHIAKYTYLYKDIYCHFLDTIVLHCCVSLSLCSLWHLYSLERCKQEFHCENYPILVLCMWQIKACVWTSKCSAQPDTCIVCEKPCCASRKRNERKCSKIKINLVSVCQNRGILCTWLRTGGVDTRSKKKKSF